MMQTMSFGSLCYTCGKTGPDGKYLLLGCLGIHVDDGIGGGSSEFLEMLKPVEK